MRLVFLLGLIVILVGMLAGVVHAQGLDYLEIRNFSLEGDVLSINYVFDNSDFVGDFVAVDFLIVNESGKVKLYRDGFSITRDGLIERKFIIEIPDELSGEYYVRIGLLDEEDYIERKILLGDAALTGDVVIDSPFHKKLGYVIFLLVVIVVIFLVIRRHENFRSEEKYFFIGKQKKKEKKK